MHSLSSLKSSFTLTFTSTTSWTNNEMSESATADVTPRVTVIETLRVVLQGKPSTMEALTDTNTRKMGLCRKDDDQMASLLEIVKRRVTRDCLFGVTVMVSIGKNPDLTRIQQELAGQLGLCLQGQGKGKRTKSWAGWLGWSGISSGSNYKDVGENARQLYDRIMQEPKILFIFRDLQQRLDLDELGIPFGTVHPGCKLILTSESEEVPTHHMNTQRTIKV